MFGVIPFVRKAGVSLGKIFKGREASDRLKKEVDDLGLEHEEVEIDVDEDGKVKVSGSVKSQEEKEKILLAVGNVAGVGEVEDDLQVGDDTPASQLYTVKSGDTLWGISKAFYNDGSRYMEIYEANTPMLKHPDKIYVGQVLRIPPDQQADKGQASA